MSSSTNKQNLLVLNQLTQLGATGLTPLDAVQHGILRLAARIYDLRQAGHDILTVREKIRPDTVIARYVLRRRNNRV